ncbi:hypothetical protein D9757_005121 [Collybiopsis confluens]|uniref:FAD/NAD(P)-binding domain-containing protein n=1 Tax=Collybiopsis confluens TaxID=2823264 RepID=A0A8H5HT59_9AGAR|nr:hypothetical protein D9757_005121 [Collybiopsis confluens]
MVGSTSSTSSRTIGTNNDYTLDNISSAKTASNAHKSVLVIGSGAAGLITAQTLINDGFTNVRVFSKDTHPGGVWEHNKVYTETSYCSLYGDYRFSSLQMPENPRRNGQKRLSAEDMQFYFEKFAETYLRDRINYDTEVLNIRRPKPPFQDSNSDPLLNWVVSYRVHGKNGTEVKKMGFHRIVLCTGGCHKPHIPPILSPSSIAASGFRGPVIHSSGFRNNLEEIFSAVQPQTASAASSSNPSSLSNQNLSSVYHPYSPKVEPNLKVSSTPLKSATISRVTFNSNDSNLGHESSKHGMVVVIGGGKSAQDIAAYLANEGLNVCIVYEKTDAFIASSRQLSDRIRKSRLMGVLSPHSDLRTPVERFLHKTWLGGKIVREIYHVLSEYSFKSFKIPHSSPLRLAQDPFWSLRVNDEVRVRVKTRVREGENDRKTFHELVNRGSIRVEAPARVLGIGTRKRQDNGEGEDEQDLTLSNGQAIRPSAIILATGYESSWPDLFDAETMNQIGLGRYSTSPLEYPHTTYEEEWEGYTSLQNPPAAPASAPTGRWTEISGSGIYRGIVPAKSLFKRDFAINGAVFSMNNAYVFETTAHWISSYFLEDTFLQLPPTVKAAIKSTERTSAWLRKRYPDMQGHWMNDSHCSDVQFWSWPQYTDDLLRDMGLPYGKARTGGNALTWLIKPIEMDAIKELGKERAALRMSYM